MLDVDTRSTFTVPRTADTRFYPGLGSIQIKEGQDRGTLYARLLEDHSHEISPRIRKTLVSNQKTRRPIAFDIGLVFIPKATALPKLFDTVREFTHDEYRPAGMGGFYGFVRQGYHVNLECRCPVLAIGSEPWQSYEFVLSLEKCWEEGQWQARRIRAVDVSRLEGVNGEANTFGGNPVAVIVIKNFA